VSFEADQHNVISTALGSRYVNDFRNQGRLQRVIVQADIARRMQPDDLAELNVTQRQGTDRAVVGLHHEPLGQRRHADGALQRLSRDEDRGVPRRARARATPSRRWKGWGTIARGLRPSKWTGQSREEKLAVPREWSCTHLPSWRCSCASPAAVRELGDPALGDPRVPLGLLGVGCRRSTLRRHANDVYMQIGLVTIIGLSAKNRS